MFKQIATKKKFRNLSVVQRNEFIRKRDGFSVRQTPSIDQLNCFSEHVIGEFSLGQSVVLDVLINSTYRHFPLVTEEPSVVAAINKAVKLFINTIDT